MFRGMSEPSASDDLQQELQKLLAKSRKMHVQSRELAAEIERVAKLIAESTGGTQGRQDLVMGSLVGDIPPIPQEPDELRTAPAATPLPAEEERRPAPLE